MGYLLTVNRIYFHVCKGLAYAITYALNNPCRNHLIVHLIVLWMIQQLSKLTRCLSYSHCPVNLNTTETSNQSMYTAIYSESLYSNYINE